VAATGGWELAGRNVQGGTAEGADASVPRGCQGPQDSRCRLPSVPLDQLPMVPLSRLPAVPLSRLA